MIRSLKLLGTQTFRAQRDWGDNTSWWKEWEEDQFVKSSEERWGVNSSILRIITDEAIALLCLHGSGWARIYPGKLHGSDPLSKTPWGLCLAPWPPSAQPPPHPPRQQSWSDKPRIQMIRVWANEAALHDTSNLGLFKVGNFPLLPCFGMSGEILWGAFTFLWGLMHGPQPKADFRTYQTNYFTGRKSLARCSFYFHYYLIQSAPEYMTGLGFLPLGRSAHCPVLIAWKNFFFFF